MGGRRALFSLLKIAIRGHSQWSSVLTAAFSSDSEQNVRQLCHLVQFYFFPGLLSPRLVCSQNNTHHLEEFPAFCLLVELSLEEFT